RARPSEVVLTSPLKGLLILSLEQAVAAPYCSSRLADAGARVIKVERAGGDFARFYDRSIGELSSYFSLFDAIADWMTVPLLQYESGGHAPERVGLAHPTICPYGAFTA